MNDFVFCGEYSVLKILQIVGIIITIAKILVPVILIVLLTIDLMKAFLAGEDKAITSAKETGIRRIIAAIIVFFIPTILNVILLNVADYKDNNYMSTTEGEWKSCAICYADPNGTSCEGLLKTAQENDK